MAFLYALQKKQPYKNNSMLFDCKSTRCEEPSHLTLLASVLSPFVMAVNGSVDALVNEGLKMAEIHLIIVIKTYAIPAKTRR